MSLKFFSFAQSPHTETLKNDMRKVAQDAVVVAQKHIVEPATEVMRGAVDSASGTAKGAVTHARTFVNKQVNRAEQAASKSWDRAARWVSVNPASSLGIAFAAGMLVSALSGRSSSKS
jgi:ElaB/YqjD/DUF883 family membrane-anchored ribosome-binding protein